jgi:AcrR family transcriptional regulator
MSRSVATGGEKKRVYESPLRADQVEQTRVRILEAVAQLLAADPAGELTIPLVARHARVSARTVYRHFPTKEAMLDQFAAWVDSQLGMVEPPASPDAVPDFARRLYRSFDEHEPLIRAALLSRAGRELQREVRARGRQSRYRALEEALEPLIAGLGSAERRRVLAIVFMLHSAPAWQALREYWGLDGDDAARAVAWALDVLVRSLGD